MYISFVLSSWIIEIFIYIIYIYIYIYILYAHLFGVGHEGLSDVSVKIIDKTNVNEPTIRKDSGHINWIILFQWDWIWETSSELISL